MLRFPPRPSRRTIWREGHLCEKRGPSVRKAICIRKPAVCPPLPSADRSHLTTPSGLPTADGLPTATCLSPTVCLPLPSGLPTAIVRPDFVADYTSVLRPLRIKPTLVGCSPLRMHCRGDVCKSPQAVWWRWRWNKHYACSSSLTDAARCRGGR